MDNRGVHEKRWRWRRKIVVVVVDRQNRHVWWRQVVQVQRRGWKSGKMCGSLGKNWNWAENGKKTVKKSKSQLSSDFQCFFEWISSHFSSKSIDFNGFPQISHRNSPFLHGTNLPRVSWQLDCFSAEPDAEIASDARFVADDGALSFRSELLCCSRGAAILTYIKSLKICQFWWFSGHFTAKSQKNSKKSDF